MWFRTQAPLGCSRHPLWLWRVCRGVQEADAQSTGEVPVVPWRRPWAACESVPLVRWTVEAVYEQILEAHQWKLRHKLSQKTTHNIKKLMIPECVRILKKIHPHTHTHTTLLSDTQHTPANKSCDIITKAFQPPNQNQSPTKSLFFVIPLVGRLTERRASVPPIHAGLSNQKGNKT